MRAKRLVGRVETAIRTRVPERALPRLVELRLRSALRDERQVAKARDELDFLLGATDLADRVEDLLPSYLRNQKWRGELRYHPERMTGQPIADPTPMLEATALGRGVVVSFLHHACYDGIFGALAGIGAPTRPVATASMFDGTAPAWMMQERVVVERGGPAINVADGAAAIRAALAAGESVGLATDAPRSSPVRFMGRMRRGASGVARLAHDLDVPVVLVTSHPRDDRDRPEAELRLRRLAPGDFASADALLAEIVSHLEGSAMAWPEAYDQPTMRWGRMEDEGPIAVEGDSSR